MVSNLANRNGKLLGFWRLCRSGASHRWHSDSSYRIYFHLPPSTKTLSGAVKCGKKQLVQPVPLEQLLVSLQQSYHQVWKKTTALLLILLHLSGFKAKINCLQKCLLSAKCGSCGTGFWGRWLRKDLCSLWSRCCSSTCILLIWCGLGP